MPAAVKWNEGELGRKVKRQNRRVKERLQERVFCHLLDVAFVLVDFVQLYFVFLIKN